MTINNKIDTPGGIELLPENVFGHTRKVQLMREACASMRLTNGPLRILDVGCGSGFAVTRFLGSPGDEVLGIDLYAPNVDYANSRFGRPGLMFECRSAASLRESADSFDVIVLADVLEHLEDPLQTVQECRRLLNAHGLLLISIPNGRGPFELESAISRMPVIGGALLKLFDWSVAVLNKYGPWKGLWTKAVAAVPGDVPYNQESGHIQFFSKRAISSVVRGAGFQIHEFRHLSFLSGPFSNFLFSASPAFCGWNVQIAERLPSFAVSGWLLVCAPVTSDSAK